jgi:hypothetical protein
MGWVPMLGALSAALTARLAAGLVMLPALLLTTTWNVAPVSVALTVGSS